jgi:hypothetical protein
VDLGRRSIRLVNAIGAIIYLVAGRRTAALVEDAELCGQPSVFTENIADHLTGRSTARTGDERRDPDLDGMK